MNLPLFETATDFVQDADMIRRRRYGVIEAAAGKLQAVRFRPWPKLVSLPEALWWGPARHKNWPGDRCRMFFNQPRGHSRYLALIYFLSGRQTTLATFYAAVRALDEIARIKQCDGIVTEASNRRISDRLFAKEGWEAHGSDPRRRQFIKRFYGVYPAM